MKYTVRDLLAHKGKGQLTEINVVSPEQAAAAEAAGIEIIVSGNRALRDELRSAAPDTHFCFGLTYGKHSNSDEAKRAAFEAMEAGADSVYCAMHYDTVEAMAREGIPVVGHVGLIPQKSLWTGLRAIGKTADEAREILRSVRRYEEAGAFAVEIEVVPHQLAEAISKSTPLVTISMGSGGGCDVQYLFAIDLLGETRGHVPRHARVYRDFAAEYDRLQSQRIEAFSEFRNDVLSGAFPASAETVTMPEKEWKAFSSELGKNRSKSG